MFTWCAKGTCSSAADTSLALQLIKISDLENDFINPHDATNSINAWVVRMHRAQAEVLIDCLMQVDVASLLCKVTSV